MRCGWWRGGGGVGREWGMWGERGGGWRGRGRGGGRWRRLGGRWEVVEAERGEGGARGAGSRGVKLHHAEGLSERGILKT